MAGLGKKTFVAGEVLLAQDVNGYLMDQSVMVFGGTAARSSAIPTPTEGMMSYRTDDDVVEVFDGSAYVGVGGGGGLVLLSKTTVGSAVSSVTITNAFSATYQNYRVAIVGIDAATTAFINLTYNGSTGSTYNSAGTIVSFGVAGVGGFDTINNAALQIGATGTDDNTNATFDIFNPFNAKFTTNFSMSVGQSASYTIHGVDKNAVSHTSFTLAPQATTFTGGTIYVYGYGAS
jgi:hypothetical protein